ncbi:MAG: hypothetical protein AB7G17_07565 [Phycisphaerales bacterium]
MDIIKTAIVTGIAAFSTQSHAQSDHPAFSEVVKVNADVAGATHALASDVTSAFGRTWVRSPDIVTSEPDWSLTTSPPRACPRFSDMDFATTPDLPESGRHELSVVFTNRARPAVAGPDVFIFSLWRDGARAGVRPVFVTPQGEIIEGPRMSIADASPKPMTIAGRVFFGVGIDVDAWAQQGAAPEGAVCAGVILDYERNDDAFAPIKIMLVEDSFGGSGAAAFMRQTVAASTSMWNGALRHTVLGSNAPVRDDPGSPSPRNPFPSPDSPTPDEAPEVPSPGPTSLALLGLAFTASRRRRAA